MNISPVLYRAHSFNVVSILCEHINLNMFKNESSFDNGISALERTFIKMVLIIPPSITPIVESNNKNLIV